MNLTELHERVLAVFFPCRCVLCGEVVAYDDLWCGKCEMKSAGGVKEREKPGPVEGAACALVYEGGVRKAVLRIKKRPDKRTLKFFADMMHKEVKLRWPDTAFEVLVPVPASAASLAEKGFNQAEKLADELGLLLGAAVCADALSRSGESLSQHSLNSRQRLLNARKSYDIAHGGMVKNKTVLLVDDIFTTGATLRACAEKLKEAGAKTVYAVTAAKTELERADFKNTNLPLKHQ